jgi:transcriptional regulator with XRE-family HTH domain
MDTPIGKQIKISRQLRDVRQSDLADATGIHATYLSAIERGTVLPNLDHLEKIQAALNLRFDDPEVEAAFAVLGGNRNGQA